MVLKFKYYLLRAQYSLGAFILLLLLTNACYGQTERTHLQMEYPLFDTTVKKDFPLIGFILPIDYMMTISQKIREGNLLEKQFPDSAIAKYMEGLTLSRKIQYNRGIMVCLVNIAACLNNRKNDLQKSVPFARLALQYGRSVDTKDRQLMSVAYHTVALDYFQKGIYDSALHYYHQIIGLLQNDSVVSRGTLAYAYAEAGAVMGNMEELKKAMVYFRKAIAESLKQKDTSSLAMVYMNIGTFYKINSIHYKGIDAYGDSALYYYEQALHLYRLKNDPAISRKMQEVYLNMVPIWTNRNNLIKAEQLLDSAVAVYPEGVHNNITLLKIMGHVYFASGNFRKALPYYKRALEIRKEKGDAKGMLGDYYLLAYIYDTLGNINQAYQHLVAHNVLKDSLQSQERIKFINELDVKYRLSEKDRALAVKESNLLKAQIQNQRKNTAIWITSLGILLLISIIVFIRYQQVNKLRTLQQQKELDILKATMDGEETERIRVGQELHDGVSGFLSAIKMNLVTLRLNRKDIALEPNFITTMQLADEAADELRKTAHNLVPSSLIKNGIGTALKGFCERVNISSSHIQIQVQEMGKTIRLDPAKELVIYRTVQELVHNIIKHSGGTEGLVSLSWQEKLLLITVEDNGKGIPEKETEGIGLENIRKRVNALNGSIEIDSAPGRGTSIYLEYTF